MYPDVSCYVSSVTHRKRSRYMYLDISDVYPKMYLGLVWDKFGIRVKYMQNVKIHVFSWNVTEHLRYIFEIHQDTLKIRVSYRIHAGYITIHQDTYRIGKNTKTYRKPHLFPVRAELSPSRP